MKKWYPKDVIALVSIVGCIVLMCLGHNHFISTSFAAIIGGYIGLDVKFNRSGPKDPH